MEGVGVQAWIMFLYTKRLINKAIKFRLPENLKLAFVGKACVPMGVFQSFSFYIQQYIVEGVRLCRQHYLTSLVVIINYRT